MPETSHRAEADGALADVPPRGRLARNFPHAGRRFRRHRWAMRGVTAIATAGLMAAVAPAASASPATASQRQQAARSGQAPQPTTAYVMTGSSTVVPVDLATNAADSPIKVPPGTPGPFETTAVATPDGRTVYELGFDPKTGYFVVTPIDTATKTAGPTITLHNVEPSDFAISPNGATAYLSTGQGVLPIDTATNTMGKLIKSCSRFGCGAIAFTPNGKALYVLNRNSANSARTVIPIRTATNTALAPVRLGVSENEGFLYNIAITPNGRTAYVVDGVYEGKPYSNSVVPIRLATNTALKPIRIRQHGFADGLVIAPGGRTAYVLSSRAVTPINIATNRARRAISLPRSAGYAYYMALTPNGRTLYVLTPRGVVPIRTASRTALPMIRIATTYYATDMAISPDGRTVYVGARNGLVPISTATNTAGKLIRLGGNPYEITFAG